MKTKSVKREQAEKRNVKRATLNEYQQINKIDDKYGVDKGAKRERARLLKRIKEKEVQKKK